MLSNIEWLNENKTRNYPFMEGLGRTERFSVGGSINTISNDFLVDMCLSGTLTNIGSNNIDYFLRRLQRFGSSQYVLNIREIQREIYDEGNSATFVDVGSFTIPFGVPFGTKIPFVPVGDTLLQGFIVIGRPLDTDWTVGFHDFLPEETTFEARTLIPSDGLDVVTSLSKEGDSNLLTGDVSLQEGNNIDIEVQVPHNALKLTYNEDIFDCEAPGNECIDVITSIKQCPQPALMTLTGVPGDPRFNVQVEGKDGIQVSALTELVPGGNPFDPSDYQVRGLVITYHGMITAEYDGVGDPNDYNSYTYGLDCGDSSQAQALENMEDQLNQLQQEMDDLEGMIP